MTPPNSKNRAKDQRPKVISFRTTLDGLSIAARQHILWPCHAFNISIPQKKKNSLNVFEETVLRITEIESGNTEKIAQITCLEKELVAFIQNRLNQLGLLCNRYELSEHGEELLNDWQNKPDEDFEYTVATVFVDLLSGKLLPYVSSEQLNYKKISKIRNNGVIDFLINPTNEKSRISARQIRPGQGSYWKKIPDSNDIIRAIREFKKKYKRHALLNLDIDQYPPSVPMAEAISLQENPELVYLHCNALIQVGNSDLLVTDGCGFGFSEGFASHLTAQDWQWVIDLKRKGVIDSLNSNQSIEDMGNERSSGEGLKKYPRISRPLQRAHKCFSDAEKINVDSSNDEQEFTNLSSQVVVALYEAIEWGLRFIVSDNPVPHWEHLFSSQSYQENDQLLRSLATKIGFDISGCSKALLQVKPGKIRAVDRGVSEMQPLLALSIAGAINTQNHPFHQLAVEDSGSLTFINILKELRDPVSHGNSLDVQLQVKTLQVYCNRTLQLIQTLIPEISDDVYAAETKRENDIDQLRLKARVELDRRLGLGFVQSLPTSLREELIKVLILNQKTVLDTGQIQQYINIMASTLQLSLFEVTKDRKTSANTPTNLRDEAIKKVIQSGFYPAPDSIPKQISTINPQRLHRAVQGSSTTLGAHLLAIFILGSESELGQLRSSYPRVVEFISHLIRLRGHGNEQQPDITRDDLESLKSNSFKAIKTLAEVF